MNIKPIKTKKMLPPADDLYSVIDVSIKNLKENDILAISSKILAIHQGRCFLIKEIAKKGNLVKKESDKILGYVEYAEKKVYLTVKNNTVIPSAGIDESNGHGYYILWPNNPEK